MPQTSAHMAGSGPAGVGRDRPTERIKLGSRGRYERGGAGQRLGTH